MAKGEQEMWIEGVRVKLPAALWMGGEAAVKVDQESLQRASKELATKLTTFIHGELMKQSLEGFSLEALMALFTATRDELGRRGLWP
jgi:hypothetical protein